MLNTVVSPQVEISTSITKNWTEQAIECYKKIGFKEYGRRHECYFLDGKWYDEISMEILEKDFRNVKMESL